MPIILSQKTIWLISIPTNLIALITGIVLGFIIKNKIPLLTYSDFVFWLLKPASSITLTLSSIILFVGFAGNIRYTKCWQGSFSFFVFLLSLIFYFSYLFSNNLIDSANKVIPQILSTGAFYQEILKSFQELNCYTWDNYSGDCEDLTEYSYLDYNCTGVINPLNLTGCHEIILEKLSNLPNEISKLCKIGFIFMLSYSIFLFLIFLFIEEESQWSEEHKPIE